MIMEGERKRSKGGFFHMFGKSRKKPLPDNLQLPEETKAWKESFESTAKSQLHTTEADDRRANASSTQGSSEFSCPSSIASDDGNANRPPSVVARLMGLESFPTSDEFSSSSRFEYDHLSSKGSREQKLQERFQTERLPSKSAKSISITHHKVLYPVKCHGFGSTKNIAQIAETAAKMVESSPRATMTTKVPSIGSHSVPLRIRELKQKMEAANRVSRPISSRESVITKNSKGQRRDKSNNGSEAITVSSGRHVMSRKEGNSISQSVRERTNAQKPDGSLTRSRTNAQKPDGSPTRSKTKIKQKEKIDVKSNQSLRSQPDVQKSVHKKASESRKNDVLRQNHQKQNSTSKKDSSTLKHSVPGSASSRGIISMTTTNGKSQSRKTASESLNSEKETKKHPPQKKQPLNKDLISLERIIAADECMNPSAGYGKNGADVVSFTFTSPMGKASTSCQAARNSDNGFAVDGSIENGNSKHSSSLPGLNLAGGDELGALLERKLRELTDIVGSSIREDNFASPVTSLKLNQENVVCSSTENSPANSNHERQQSEETVEEPSCSSNYSEIGEELEPHYPSTTTILYPTCSDNQGSNNDRSSPSQSTNNFSESMTNGTLDERCTTDLSDSATSSFPTNWELHYVRNILEATEMRIEHLASPNRTSKIVPTNLFENEENKLDVALERHSSKLDRKVVFDCIGEFLDSKCRRQISVGSWEGWAKFGALVERRSYWPLLLAEELHREMVGWQGMGDLVVDELVDWDMSTGDGKWVEFGVEVSEESGEIEEGVLDCMVDELVSELLDSM